MALGQYFGQVWPSIVKIFFIFTKSLLELLVAAIIL